MITNIPAPDHLDKLLCYLQCNFFTDQRIKKDGSDFEQDKMSSFQKTPLHIGERITYGFALRTENSAIFEGTEFSQSAPCVSAGKLCAQRTNLTILIKFPRSQNGRRCKEMQKDFAQVRNVF